MKIQLSSIALQLTSIALLASCAATPPASQRVEVPVMAPCISAVPQRPTYEFDQLAPAATDGEIVLALARDWLRARKYEEQLEAVIMGCQQE
ncbi:hypothetical protein [Janthinobacterium sp. UMAB-56]|uniref:hypothetical protein n=1 Tax=Janthinobacterium sp. UMAB-56 TaxID=1365361 RepID=UPI001C5791A7|nr:hypothetical protein [Janthinobacterium sp. UMAB-56]